MDSETFGQNQESDNLQKVAQFIQRFKSEYFGSTVFQNYKRRCDVSQLLVNQEKGAVELSTKFTFQLGLCRTQRDDFVESCMDIFDQDKWINCSSLKTGDYDYSVVNDIEHFGNNIIADADYKAHWLERMAFLPVFGWSISFSEFRWNSGWTVKPKTASAEGSGILWSRELDESLSKPVCTAIHPYNWFGDVGRRINKQIRQGIIKRWTIRDVVYAMAKMQTMTDPNGDIVMREMVDENGQVVLDGETGMPIMEPVEQPTYNTQALQKMLDALTNGSKTKDEHYYNSSQRNTGDLGGNDSRSTSQDDSGRFIDVLYYVGTLDEVEGFYGDPNIYIVESYGGEVLRIQENPIDCLSPINHIQTHPHSTDCLTDTMLDVVVPHDKIMYLLVNMGIENVFDDLHRVTVIHEEDYINLDDLLNPKSLNTVLYLQSQSVRTVPAKPDNGSGSLQSMQQVFGLVNMDRQRAGVTDQQLGVQVQGDKTATSARILASATNKKTRAIIKRCCADGLLPEFRYILMLGMQFYSPEKLKAMSKKGEIMRITEDVVQMIVNKNGFRVNDNFTRDKDSDAQNLAEFMGIATPVLQGLSKPEHAVNMVRNLARLKGIDEILDIDTILPAPNEQTQEQDQEVQMPNKGEMSDPQVAQNPMLSESQEEVMESYNENQPIV